MVDARTLQRMSGRSSPPAAEPVTRQERKQRTRQALLDAALTLLEERSFARLSLREVAKEAGIVPTAFYRHFATMDELGIALVEQSMRTLRAMIREGRRDPSTSDAIRRSVDILYAHVRAHESHFRFLARERYSGTGPVQAAIATELRLFSSELAVDLGRFDGLAEWTSEDLRMMAELIVTAMLGTALDLLAVRPTDPGADAEIVRTARKRLRLIVLGAVGWRSTAD